MTNEAQTLTNEEQKQRILSILNLMPEARALLETHEKNKMEILFDNEVSDAAYYNGALHVSPHIPREEQVVAVIWALRIRQQEAYMAELEKRAQERIAESIPVSRDNTAAQHLTEEERAETPPRLEDIPAIAKLRENPFLAKAPYLRVVK